MKHCKVPSLLAEALKKLPENLHKDFCYFWPAGDNRDIQVKAKGDVGAKGNNKEQQGT